VKLLLDNCVPYRAKQLFLNHDVEHAADIGFEQLRNGELIGRAANRFAVIVTTDKKIRHEHNLAKLPLSIVELNTRFTRFEDLATLAPFLESALAATLEYRFVGINPDGSLEKLEKYFGQDPN
jgi:hypothetical protein